MTIPLHRRKLLHVADLETRYGEELTRKILRDWSCVAIGEQCEYYAAIREPE